MEVLSDATNSDTDEERDTLQLHCGTHTRGRVFARASLVVPNKIRVIGYYEQGRVGVAFFFAIELSFTVVLFSVLR